MNLFPIFGRDRLIQLQNFLKTEPLFLSKWGFSEGSIMNYLSVEKLISHPKQMWTLLGQSEDVLCGFSLLSFQGIPHAFAQMDLIIQPMDGELFRHAVEKVSDFGFQEMALESIQIPLLEVETEKTKILSALGWTLDATLKEEREWQGLLIDEYRFGRIK